MNWSSNVIYKNESETCFYLIHTVEWTFALGHSCVPTGQREQARRGPQETQLWEMERHTVVTKDAPPPLLWGGPAARGSRRAGRSDTSKHT